MVLASKDNRRYRSVVGEKTPNSSCIAAIASNHHRIALRLPPFSYWVLSSKCAGSLLVLGHGVPGVVLPLVACCRGVPPRIGEHLSIDSRQEVGQKGLWGAKGLGRTY